MSVSIAVDPYPTLDARAFITTFPASMEEVARTSTLSPWLAPDASAPISRSEAIRTAVRDLLRHKGYKPTGRGKPASEYLVKAAEQGTLGSINPAVDACNVVSLHSGFPISVIDLSKASAPFRIAPALEGTKYVFNTSGQEIDVAGLLCLHDAEGACANPVKDSQRTKTDASTTRTLTVIWGLDSFPSELDAAAAWYESLLRNEHADIEWVLH